MMLNLKIKITCFSDVPIEFMIELMIFGLPVRLDTGVHKRVILCIL